VWFMMGRTIVMMILMLTTFELVEGSRNGKQSIGKISAIIDTQHSKQARGRDKVREEKRNQVVSHTRQTAA
jgi:hypothetical protein